MELRAIIYVDSEGRYTVGQAGPTAPAVRVLRQVDDVVGHVASIPAIEGGRYSRPVMVGGFSDPTHTAALAAALKERLPQLDVITQ